MLSTGWSPVAQGEEDVPAADDRLVGVVRVEMQAAPHEDAGENVAGCCDALAGGATDSDRYVHAAPRTPNDSRSGYDGATRGG